MKKIVTVILLLSITLSLSACGDSGASGRTGSGSPTVSDVLESGMASEDGESAETRRDEKQEISPEETASVSEEENTHTAAADETVDIDLTAMSSTMVFSEVSAMLAEPDSFLGKTVRMAGQFAIYEDPSTGNIYFACIVQDATACCSNGIEFILEGEPEYPQGYPELGSEIIVTGTFDKYEENGYYYITLREAHLT